MSLPPVDRPFYDEEEDRKRRAEIEGMMRWQREAYFRNEPVQQEYRDVIDRQEARREAAAREARGPGPFDVALARFMEGPTTTRKDWKDIGDSDSPEVQPAALLLKTTPKRNVVDPSFNVTPVAQEWRVSKTESPQGSFQVAAADPKAVFGAKSAEDAAEATTPPDRLAAEGLALEGRKAVDIAAKETTGQSKLSPEARSQPVRMVQQQTKSGTPKANPVTRLGEWLLDYKKYVGEVEQFAKSKRTKPILFRGKPIESHQVHNAFVHAAMSALYAYDKGFAASLFVGHMRELETEFTHWKNRNDPVEARKKPFLDLDTYKDLFNNSIGMQIGLAAKKAGLTRSEILHEVFEALENGKLIADEFVDPRVDKDFNGNPFSFRSPKIPIR